MKNPEQLLSGIKVSAGNISIVFGALFNKGRQEKSLKVINIRRAETKPPFYYRQYNLLPRLLTNIRMNMSI